MFTRLKPLHVLFSIVFSLLIVFLFFLNNIHVSFLSGSIAEKVGIRINSGNLMAQNQIKLYIITHNGKSIELDNLSINEWKTINNLYIKSILVAFSPESTNIFDTIELKIANRKFLFKQRDISDNWARIDNEFNLQYHKPIPANFAVYEMPASVGHKSSLFSYYSRIINWQDDFTIVFKSIKFENLIQFFFLVLFFLSLFMFNHPSKSPNKKAFPLNKEKSQILIIKYLPAALLFIILLVLIFLTFKDYGVTWDEPVQHIYGIKIIDYYSSFFTDQSAKSFSNLYLYGGFVEVILELSSRVLNFKVYESRHLINAFLGIIGIFGVWKLANLIAGYKAALLSSFILTVIPSYYGHMFFNSKDIPVAVGMIWSLYFISQYIYAYPDIPIKLLIKTGVIMGITVAIRSASLIIVLYLLMIIVVLFIYEFICKYKGRFGIILPYIAKDLINIIIILGFALFMIWIFWPITHDYPITGVILPIKEMSVTYRVGKVLYNGSLIMSNQLPWHYIFVHLFIKLPEIITLFIPFTLIVFIFYAVNFIKKNHIKNRNSFNKMLIFLLLIISFIFPIIYTIINKTIIYDEIRHLLFIYPILAVLTGITLSVVLRYLCNKQRFLFWGITAIIVLFFVYHIFIMVRLHPHQYVYYNQFVGGPAGAERIFVTDYWANSYMEAFIKLKNYLKEKDKEDFTNRKYKVFFKDIPDIARYYLTDNFRLTYLLEEADYAISFTRYEADRHLPGKTIIRVERLGCLLSVVNEIH